MARRSAVAREDDGRAAWRRAVACVEEGILATEENGEVDDNPGRA